MTRDRILFLPTLGILSGAHSRADTLRSEVL